MSQEAQNHVSEQASKKNAPDVKGPLSFIFVTCSLFLSSLRHCSLYVCQSFDCVLTPLVCMTCFIVRPSNLFLVYLYDLTHLRIFIYFLHFSCLLKSPPNSFSLYPQWHSIVDIPICPGNNLRVPYHLQGSDHLLALLPLLSRLQTGYVTPCFSQSWITPLFSSTEYSSDF